MNIGDKVVTYVEAEDSSNRYNGIGVIKAILHEGYFIEETTSFGITIKIYKRDMIEKVKQDNCLS